MITLEIAKQNLFQMKGLSYLEAIQTKVELIKNQDKLEIDVNSIVIKKVENKYYLQYITDDEIKMTLAEKQ